MAICTRKEGRAINHAEDWIVVGYYARYPVFSQPYVILSNLRICCWWNKWKYLCTSRRAAYLVIEVVMTTSNITVQGLTATLDSERVRLQWQVVDPNVG